MLICQPLLGGMAYGRNASDRLRVRIYTDDRYLDDHVPSPATIRVPCYEEGAHNF
jgi:hypothetical protein